MLSVDEALQAILRDAKAVGAETLPIKDAQARTLADKVVAQTTQPPFDVSAMDGYAVRFEDASQGARLNVIGESRAGAPFQSAIGPGEAARIFTGAVVPDGADHILIQEDATRDGDGVVVTASQPKPRHIRRAGIDFSVGDVIFEKGRRLSPIDLSLIAAANVAEVSLVRQPVVAYFDNGDELVEPGERLAPGEIVGSNRFAFEGLIARWGGAPRYLGRAGDDVDTIIEFFTKAQEADVITPIGGASVGDYDYVKAAFAAAGGHEIFAKIAVRPGKPTWFGRLSDARVLGLPGNPASSFVCAIVFLRPLIRALSGGDAAALCERAPLAAPLSANGPRESYLRAERVLDQSGRKSVRAFDNQDSSLLRNFAAADCLIRRPANAPPSAKGDLVELIEL